MEIKFNIGVSDSIQNHNTDYTDQFITINQFVNHAKEGRSFRQFQNSNGRYNLIVFDFIIEYQTPRSIQQIMNWSMIQPTIILYYNEHTHAHARAKLIYYVEEGFSIEEFIKIYKLLMYVVFAIENLALILVQNDLSFLLNDVQYIDNSSPVKSEVYHENTVSVDKLNQLYKLNFGCKTYGELYDRIVLPYFKREFDNMLNPIYTKPSPITTTDNEIFDNFKSYYETCPKKERTIRKLAKHFKLTRYRSELLIKMCLVDII